MSFREQAGFVLIVVRLPFYKIGQCRPVQYLYNMPINL